MSTTRLFQSVFLASLACLVGIEARAEPMLLMEITQRGDDPFSQGGPDGAIFMSFAIGEGKLEDAYATTDIGRVIEPSEPTFAAMESAANLENTFVSMRTAYPARFTERVDTLWSEVGDVWTTIEAFVPRLGVGFTGYDITAITQTIDQIQWTQSGGNWYGVGQQTVRIYGQVVPEPPTWLLMLFVILAYHSTRPHHPVFAV